MRAALLPLLLLLAACGTNDVPDDAPEASGEPAEAAVDPEVRGQLLALEAESGGEVEVGVTDAVLFLRLSESVRSEARKEMEAEMADQDGIGRALGDMVTGVVNTALGTTVQVPLAEVDALRYVDGRLLIDGMGDSVSINEGDLSDEGLPFEEDAARRLIDAFEDAR
jgi:hypothetical protein